MNLFLRLTWCCFIGFCLVACQETEDINAPGSNPSGGASTSFAWTIPANQVFDGGVGKDGIPSIDQPEFSSVEEADRIPDWEFIVAVKRGNEIKAYPHNILDWHEIVNDRISGKNFALTYCPLTGTAIGWERGEGTFGVSGLLYNSNLIPYDRISGSYWSQMLNESVRGVRVDEEVERIAVMESRWRDFKKDFPEARVLTRNTGFDRNYDNYPYGDYRSSPDLLFPVARRDSRVFAKERVHGIQMSGINRIYQFDAFQETSFLIDEMEGTDILLMGNREMGFISSFVMEPVRGETLVFSAVSDPTLDRFITDQFGNYWNVFGEVSDGPNVGIKLTPAPSYMGFYFAWAAFNPSLQIYGSE